MVCANFVVVISTTLKKELDSSTKKPSHPYNGFGCLVSKEDGDYPRENLLRESGEFGGEKSDL